VPQFNSQRLAGVLTVGLSTLPILLALGGELDEGDPPVWVLVAAFGMFWFVGLLLLVEGTRFEQYIGLLTAGSVLLGLGLILNWGAFGPGERECAIAISLPFLAFGSEAGDTECRVVIGYVAAILDAVLLIILASRGAVMFGDHAWTKALLYLGYGLLFVLLLPVVLLALIGRFASGGGGEKIKSFFSKLTAR
jgi:hypothetical protein